MKVLHVYRTCYPETNGGLEQVIRFLCKGCQEYGVTSKILSLSDDGPKSYYFEGTEIILTNKDMELASNGFSLSLFKKFRELSKWADIIHYHYPWPTGDLLSLIAPKKPSLVTYHSDIVRQKWLRVLYTPLECFFLGNVEKIVATSPQYLESSPVLKKYENKVEIIPLGIDPQLYPPPKEYQLSKVKQLFGDNFFLFIGALRYYKGLDYLLDAAKLVPHCTIIIAGQGPEREHLQERIKLENIRNVKMIGHVTEEEKACLLELCKGFLFPSHLRSEAFGVSLLEAQLYSKPVISCDIGTGTSYVNINNVTGLKTRPKDEKDLASALAKLANSEKLRNQLGKNGRHRVVSKFTNKAMCHKQARAYLNLVPSTSTL